MANTHRPARKAPLRIGGASGFWGDASLATPQLLAEGDLDVLVYDYLAEITMSILARARAKDPNLGYATDFVTQVIQPHIDTLAEQGVKVIANAGGVNPAACAEHVRAIIAAKGLSLKVAVIQGDDLGGQIPALKDHTEMFSDDAFPPTGSVASANAYLGAFPIARALDRGADIVITGRCVDSAVTLGACIHAFGWQRDDLDKLAQASLAGHLLECGTQVTGGNFTDWREVAGTMDRAGYPIAEIQADGRFVCTKARRTGGLVSVGTVAEQLLYEIGDPQAYLLPDVICDFSRVTLAPAGLNRVAVRGAIGRGVPTQYKTSVTFADGFRGGQVWTFYGIDAEEKAQSFADSVLARCETLLAQSGLPPFSDASVEIIGAESHYGAARQVGPVREVDLKLAVRHPSPKGVGLLLKNIVGMALSAPPGLTGFAGARPKPSPVVRLFSCLVDKAQVPVTLHDDQGSVTLDEHRQSSANPMAAEHCPVPAATGLDGETTRVPLVALAWGRSGDKGDKANIGIIARQAEYLPYIAASLTPRAVQQAFSHFLAEDAEPVERFYLPGCHALNFLLHRVLDGGGVASLRVDPQGKGYAQLLLSQPIVVPIALAAELPGTA